MSILNCQLRHFVFASAALLMAASAQAQTVTLSQALEKIGVAPKVERAKSAAEEASWKKVESYSGFLPKLDFTASYLLDKKYMLVDINLGSGPASIQQVIPTTNFALGGSWLLFDGFANVDRYMAASEGAEAGKKDYNWAKFQQEREVILLFYRALAAQSLKQVAEQNVKTLEDHLNDARLLKKSGMSTNYDVLQVEVRSSEARSEILNANDNVNVAVLRLGETLGQDYSQVQLSGKLPEFATASISSLKDKDISERQDIAALRHRVNSLEQSTDATGKHWVPKVALVGNYQKYNNINSRFDDKDALRDAYSVGVQLSWNLFDGMASTARDHQVIEQRYQTEKALQMAQDKANNDLELWKRKFNYYISVYEARKSDVQKATESMRLAKEGRRAGVRTNTDLLDAELELFRASAGVVNAQIGAVEALVNLELASGQKLYQF
jgi:outer membrane protein TolC